MRLSVFRLRDIVWMLIWKETTVVEPRVRSGRSDRRARQRLLPVSWSRAIVGMLILKETTCVNPTGYG